MLFLKHFTVFLLVFLVGKYPIAKAEEPIFTNLKIGDKAPFAGYLFSPEAIVKVYSTCKEDLNKAELECTADLSSLNLEIQHLKEIHITEIQSKDTLIEKITILKNKSIEERDKIINNIEEERLKNIFYISGAFLAGMILTGTVFYIALGAK